MRLIVVLVRLGVMLAAIVGGACVADFVWRTVQPENTRHAQFGEPCRAIHIKLAERDGKAPPAHCIRVHFGTPRARVGAPGERDFGFGREVDGELHLGYADVSLPLLASEEKDGQSGVRKRGEVDLKPDGAPDSRDDTARFASITTIEESGSRSAFVASLTEALAESDANALLVFVHGYNQSFDSALIRTAQISVDLTFDPDDPANTKSDKPGYGEPSYAFGRPVLFSWPNGAFLCAYCSDRKKAELSAPYLAEFLTLLMRDAHTVEEVNIVVHSMGNEVLVNAIEEIAREHVRLKRVRKFRIVNAAADVGRDAYSVAMARAEAQGGGAFAPQVTIYASRNDIAMAASWLVNGFKARLGQILPTQRPFESADDRYVAIDTDVVSADLFGHGYYSESGNVIADMSCFFADRPIGSERAIAPVETLGDGRRHYRFVPPSEIGLRVCAPGAAPLMLASADEYFSAIGLSYEDYGRRRRDALSGPPPQPAPAPAPPPPDFAEISVYFANGDSAISEEAAAFLNWAAETYKERGGRLELVGHADAAEAAEGIADAISLARAEAARAYLVDSGVPFDAIEVKGVGASEPRVLTPPGVREPQNRRVDIRFLD